MGWKSPGGGAGGENQFWGWKVRFTARKLLLGNKKVLIQSCKKKIVILERGTPILGLEIAIVWWKPHSGPEKCFWGSKSITSDVSENKDPILGLKTSILRAENLIWRHKDPILGPKTSTLRQKFSFGKGKPDFSVKKKQPKAFWCWKKGEGWKNSIVKQKKNYSAMEKSIFRGLNHPFWGGMHHFALKKKYLGVKKPSTLDQKSLIWGRKNAFGSTKILFFSWRPPFWGWIPPFWGLESPVLAA